MENNIRHKIEVKISITLFIEHELDPFLQYINDLKMSVYCRNKPASFSISVIDVLILIFRLKNGAIYYSSPA